MCEHALLIGKEIAAGLRGQRRQGKIRHGMEWGLVSRSMPKKLRLSLHVVKHFRRLVNKARTLKS